MKPWDVDSLISSRPVCCSKLPFRVQFSPMVSTRIKFQFFLYIHLYFFLVTQLLLYCLLIFVCPIFIWSLNVYLFILLINESRSAPPMLEHFEQFQFLTWRHKDAKAGGRGLSMRIPYHHMISHNFA